MQIIERAVSDLGFVLGLKGRLRDIVYQAYILSLEFTHGT